MAGDGGFKREAVFAWLSDNGEWGNIGNPPRITIRKINGRKVTEDHQDTVERWLATGRDPIPLGRWDELLLTYGVMLWEFELDYPNAYVPG